MQHKLCYKKESNFNKVITTQLHQKKNMKLICSLLVTLGQCSPKRERGLNIAGVSSNSDSWRPGKGHPGHPEGIPSTPCANRGIQTVENVDNNDNGKLTIDHYEGDLHCYVEIGSKCNSDGVEVEFTDMTIENSWDYENQYGSRMCRSNKFFHFGDNFKTS